MISSPIQLVEENLGHFLLTMGRALEFEEFISKRIHWIIPYSPFSYYNAVFRTQLHQHEISNNIKQFIRQLKECGLLGHWFVTPSSQPIDLEEKLICHGFALIEEEPQLIYDLSQVNALPSQAHNFRILPVRTKVDSSIHAELLSHGFEDSAWVCEAFQRIGLNDSAPFQSYIGYFEDQPIATASLLHCGNTTGLYYVCVHSAYRNQGFGTAILIALLRKAFQQGYQHLSLGASDQGYALYLRLGFQDVCTFKFYEFNPQYAD